MAVATVVASLAAHANDLIAVKPGIMCASREALAELTLPGGDSRTHATYPNPKDLQSAALGSCIDIPVGTVVTLQQAQQNTSVISYNGKVFVVPSIDFKPVRVISEQWGLGPSFECAKAKDTLAVLICSDSRLSRLDLLFVQAYQALKQQLGDQGQRDLRQEAIDFQGGAYQACGLPRSNVASNNLASTAATCVGQIYERQRGAWVARLQGAAIEEASRGLERHIALQLKLQQLGFLAITAMIDGVYGTETRTAISDWQRSRAGSVTGLLGDADALALEQSAETALSRQADQVRLEADMARETKARGQALAELEAALPYPHDVAAILVKLGSSEDRVRRSLKGQFILQDTAKPARGCMIITSTSDPRFVTDVIQKLADRLLGNPPPSYFRACSADSLQHSDLVLVLDPSHGSLDRPTAAALTGFIHSSTFDELGHYSVGEWQAALAEGRRIDEERKKVRDQISSAIRAGALDGSFLDWGAAQLLDTADEVACVVAPTNLSWGNVLSSSLPEPNGSPHRRVIVDPDVDKQFGRFLAAECTVIVARGADFADILRGLNANRRTAAVLPIRISQADLEKSLISKQSTKSNGENPDAPQALSREVVPASTP